MLLLCFLLLLTCAFSLVLPEEVPHVQGLADALQLEDHSNTHFFSSQSRLGLHKAASPRDQRVLTQESANSNSTLDVFQVYKPVSIPEDAEHMHSVLLIEHSFGNSYGRPYVGNYTPPEIRFTNVHINLTVISKGRQFDRLGVLYFGDVEVFRTSTAEPSPQGIVWFYTKDMTAYLALWRDPQKIIFDLGNLLNDIYTGSFNVTLEATFFTVPQPVVAADLILPISAKRSSTNKPSAFTLPSDNATTIVSIPPNVSRAIVSIAACGQADEEFWYSNVPSSLTSTFTNTTGELPAFSSFREVQLYIDGMLAGVVWPFPIIFTGGIAPGLWRPMVGIDAFDLREFEIDIAPFIMLLTDGKPHSFEIRVVGLDDSDSGQGSVLSNSVSDYWVVTGKVFIFLDPFGPNPQWEPIPPVLEVPPPSISVEWAVSASLDTPTQKEQNDTMVVQVNVERSINIFSFSGFWRQTLMYECYNEFRDQGLYQLTQQSQWFDLQAVAKLRDDRPAVEWSLFVTQPVTVQTNLTVSSGDQGQWIKIEGQVWRSRYYRYDGSARPDISLHSLTQGDSQGNAYQRGTAEYSSEKNKSYSFGSTLEEFEEESGGERRWDRRVEVVNGSVVRDTNEGVGWREFDSVEFLEGQAIKEGLVPVSGRLGRMEMGREMDVNLDSNARARIGRGPGDPRQLPFV